MLGLLSADFPDMIVNTLLSLSDVAVIVLDNNEQVTYWGKGAESLYEIGSEDAIHRPVEQLIQWPLDRPDATEAPRGDLKGSVRRESIHKKKTGEPVWVELFYGPLTDAAGHAVGRLVIAADITERKRAEGEGMHLLTDEQAARKQAEEANLTKDKFLAMVVHQLRTPLQSILGWTHLLSSGTIETVQYPQAFGVIRQNAESLSKLIEDLLDVSRINTGHLHINLRPVELATVIDLAMQAARPALQAKTIRLEAVLDSTVGTVSGDPDRIQQMVSELLSNAIKFTPSGGRIEIRLEPFNADAQLTVSDSGQGIDPKALPHVFDPFWQARSETTIRRSGLGLGLAIVRHLVELHQGTIWAESNGDGQGARFIIRLPLSRKGTPAPGIKTMNFS